MPAAAHALPDAAELVAELRDWAGELGFQQLGIADTHVKADAAHLERWLDEGMHGEMDYMARHADLRAQPEKLVQGTLRLISVRMDYGDANPDAAWATLHDGERAYIARYAFGRDYHKLIRNRLQKLADRLAARIGPFGYRAFVDSAPVLERAIARNAGLGWIGKHTCLINRHATLRHLHALHRRVPDASDHCAVSRGCTALHQLPHHRTARCHSRRPARPDGQPHLRLR